MLSRSRPCQRSLALRQLATRKLPRSHVTTFRSASAKPPSFAATASEAQQQWKTGSAHEGSPRTRGFATAVDDLRFDGVPNNSQYSMPPPTNPLYHTRPLTGPNTLRLPELMAPKVPRLHQAIGVPGDVSEMFAILEACLTIGKLDRAGVVLKRLSSPQLHMIDRGDIMVLHNLYLQAAVEQLAASPSDAKAEHIHQWYETEIRKANLPETPETIAYLLKAAFLVSPNAEDLRLQRLVTRYMAMAPGETGLAVLYQTDILTDKDRAMITKICPTYNITIQDSNLEAQPEQSAQEMEMGTATDSSTVESNFPEVLPTPQKGFGLKTVKRTLSLFREIPYGRRIADLAAPEQREIQMRLERDVVDAAIERWREDNQALNKMGLNTSMSSSRLNARLYDWHLALENRLKEYLAETEVLEQSKKRTVTAIEAERTLIAPFIRQSTPARIAAVTILSIMSSLALHGADRGIPVTATVSNVARAAEEDVVAYQRSLRAKQQKAQRKMSHTQEEMPQDMPYIPRDGATLRTIDLYRLQKDSSEKWPVSVKTTIGSSLIGALLDTATITVTQEDTETKKMMSSEQPAFIRAIQYRKGKKIGVIIPNKVLIHLMLREPRGEFLARHLPMVCEPEPWTRFDKGAYIEQPASLIRMKRGEKDQQIYAEAAIARGDMEQVTRGLDALGRTGWRINKPVLEVILNIWNSGEALAGIPPLNPVVPIPEEPSSTDDPLARVRWIKALKEAENIKSSYHSQRCHFNFQLEIARAYRDQTMYFPHNVDFRGRAYPIPVHLNHMGADLARAMLLFDKGKPLGENGLHWLKVHLANVYGFDKASLSERAQFCLDHMEDIIDSANNPMSGKRWWLDAEDPWQCLATCKELKAAFESPDPTKYVCHLPIHQDGTCNGLQHYAALGGDSWGARQVNLEPGDRPADVYSAVASLVIESIEKDHAAGSKFATALLGKIKRKVVKQTVMTNVYGVTFMGAKAQVKKQLDAMYPNLKQESGIDTLFLSSYIAIKIFTALSTMFQGAHDIQAWLGEIGSRVCRAITPDQMNRLSQELAKSQEERAKALRTLKTTGNSEYDDIILSYKKVAAGDLLNHFRSTIIWTTPLRMPVVQPYRKCGVKIVRTNMQDLVLRVSEPWDPVHRRKQLQAFPPNFVHSLDASHMMLSALECEANGLTFAAVHDSFWTHACDVQKMSNILRDAFIRIHEEDVIKRLADEFEARYKGSLYLVQVDSTSDAAKAVVEWRQKHPRFTLSDELFLEKRKLELLRSEDPKDRAQGEALETPSSLYKKLRKGNEEIVDPDDISTPLSAIPKGALLGHPKPLAKNKEKESVLHERVDELVDPEFVTESADASSDGWTGEESTESHMERMLDTSHFSVSLSGENKRKSATRKVLSIWMPLTFPKIPKKGDFDVSRLKSSKYFFS